MKLRPTTTKMRVSSLPRNERNPYMELHKMEQKRRYLIDKAHKLALEQNSVNMALSQLEDEMQSMLKRIPDQIKADKDQVTAVSDQRRTLSY